ncbi:putative RNA polymerase II Elongator complex associated protein Kti12 [Aspergillus luchuensis]|uniref:Uncharacterized protein n=1 Tax=Aspergillus kawachii TaxID=1069201 RepID=A0A7R7ZZ37_ASPKA|nr:uncharacterized protein AKAW2_40479A [Aspergillus luchuensis]BCR98796.1 hypothetical protein AKAW2_40479A [Aspergillus luchuensis]BCS11115.1 hypothetical protein ALUC_40455A [Aspergillus luchuensis]GAA88337.1 RNA polymerase II Elongator complex associated protein Kti12 [Aspergillus luchuensis IFO 4308]
MPLIVLTGYPCSGLTYRANQLAKQLEETQTELFNTGALPSTKPRYKIHVVPTHDPSHPRTVYDHARTEKETRGVAYARAKRALGKDSFVILDGMNYIKGYRYQLWCEAKALGTTCCVVHVGTPIDQCVANNEARLRRQKDTDDNNNENNNESTPQPDTEATQSPTEPTSDQEDPYPPELLNNLIFRYEEPSIHSRWDKPLFTVPWTDASPPIAEIWTALTGIPHPSAATTPDPNTSVSTLTSALNNTSLSSAASTTTTANNPSTFRTNRPKIKPHQATALPAATDSTALYNMEKRTSAIVSAIRSFTLSNPSAEAALAQCQDGNSSSSNGRGISIPVPEASMPVYVPAHVATSGTTDELAGAGGILALPRLQRLRRQWIALNRAYVQGAHASSKGGLTAEQVPDAFVRFLNAEFGAEGE